MQKTDLVKPKFKAINVHQVFYYHENCLIKMTEEKCQRFREVRGKNYKQSNLAGCIECDPFIQLELDLAGIPVVNIPRTNSEVPYTKIGLLKVNEKTFKFKRAWYYWIVSGDVPLSIAKKIYNSELGEKDVCAVGHAGRVNPEQWVDENNNITSYHIDSWQGLKFFVDTLQVFRDEI